MRAQIASAGWPEPRSNVAVDGIEVDLLWPQRRLVAAVDGPGHTRPRTASEDAERDALLTAAGYRVVRLTGRRG